MSFYILNSRRQLEMTSSQKGLTAGLSIAAALILAVLALCAYRRHQRMNTPPQEEEKEIAVVTQEETSQESSEEEDVEVALTESKSSELSYDKSISMCRSETMNSLDVHTCQSGSCDLCRKNQEPNFVGVKKVVNEAEKGRIRSLPDRWWENPLGYLSAAKQPEVMQTIVSMSKSEGSEWGESVYDDEASHEQEESLHLEDRVVRD